MSTSRDDSQSRKNIPDFGDAGNVHEKEHLGAFGAGAPEIQVRKAERNSKTKKGGVPGRLQVCQSPPGRDTRSMASKVLLGCSAAVEAPGGWAKRRCWWNLEHPGHIAAPARPSPAPILLHARPLGPHTCSAATPTFQTHHGSGPSCERAPGCPALLPWTPSWTPAHLGITHAPCRCFSFSRVTAGFLCILQSGP